MKNKLFKIVLGSLLALQAASSFATSVAYIGSCSSGNYLTSYGFSVTHINNPFGSGYLNAFDAAIVSSNCQFSDAVGLGNELKSFADAGGGVVLAEFAFQGTWQVGGGINQAGYNPFVNDPLSSNYYGHLTLGNVFDPTSPLFSGVNLANVATDYAADVGLDAGATLVANWNNGRGAIAFNSLGSNSVVGLNLFPSDGYVNLDTQRLVANAINFSLDAHGENNVPEPGTLTLLGLSLVGLGIARRRKSRPA